MTIMDGKVVVFYPAGNQYLAAAVHEEDTWRRYFSKIYTTAPPVVLEPSNHTGRVPVLYFPDSLRLVLALTSLREPDTLWVQDIKEFKVKHQFNASGCTHWGSDTFYIMAGVSFPTLLVYDQYEDTFHMDTVDISFYHWYGLVYWEGGGPYETFEMGFLSDGRVQMAYRYMEASGPDGYCYANYFLKRAIYDPSNSSLTYDVSQQVSDEGSACPPTPYDPPSVYNEYVAFALYDTLYAGRDSVYSQGPHGKYPVIFADPAGFEIAFYKNSWLWYYQDWEEQVTPSGNSPLDILFDGSEHFICFNMGNYVYVAHGIPVDVPERGPWPSFSVLGNILSPGQELVVLADGPGQAEVYDMSGRKVRDFQLESGKNQLDINLSQGIYLLRIAGESRAFVIK